MQLALFRYAPHLRRQPSRIRELGRNQSTELSNHIGPCTASAQLHHGGTRASAVSPVRVEAARERQGGACPGDMLGIVAGAGTGAFRRLPT